ncbi:MAG TPA: hypothetical protein VGC15_19830 [Acetobacteraceae bacterium]
MHRIARRTRRSILPSLVVAALLALPGCGDLPQPFLGRPGGLASRLSQPPPSRLSIPTPTESLLPDAAATAWAGAIAEALVTEEIPAAANPSRRRGDWALILSAEMRGRDVVPTYTVQNPAGVAQGFSEGAPVPAAEWASGSPAVLKAAAVQAAPGVASLLQKIEAARQLSDPNSLMNRPSRVYFAGVTGAPGDGNTSLATQMQTKLTGLGLVVQDTPRGADFALRGEIKTAVGAKGAMRIELQWVVVNGDEAAAERGRVVQLNEVPPGSLDSYWGDVAVVVATEAATGVRDVILNSGGGRAPAK